MNHDILPIRRAVLSVYNKEGIVDLARALTAWGVEVLSTGGTARLLQGNNVAVTPIETLTGFAEMLGGRVKTLHPAVHGGILADRGRPDHFEQLTEADIGLIDLVVVNLYPFEQAVARGDCTLEEAIEEIDIGGPCMIRAAARNHPYVLPWCEPTYEALLAELQEHNGASRLQFRREAAARAFTCTSSYDALIAQYLAHSTTQTVGDILPARLAVPLHKKQNLRYGENPHQPAALYETVSTGPASNEANLVVPQPVGGKKMSFNNYHDGNAALELIKDLSFYMPYTAACVFVKHNNPCGVAVARDPLDAYHRAYLADPIATMGGVLAINKPVNRALAEAVMGSLDRWGCETGAQGFLLEVWIAPSFDPDAQAYIEQARPWGCDVRRIATGQMNYPRLTDERDFRRITGGMLIQQRDIAGLDEDDWVTVTHRAPHAQELSDLQLAWLVAKHTHSNAIVLAREGQVIGIATGQASRLTACRLAVQLAKENGHAHKLPGAVAASDGYFPFKDAPAVLLSAGIKAIIHPGGSKRDADSVTLCDENDAVMIMTSTRHFKH